jgi:hypothetical protein
MLIAFCQIRSLAPNYDTSVGDARWSGLPATAHFPSRADELRRRKHRKFNKVHSFCPGW